ncbi:NYN domain-containing protein [Rosettibacter firmus]|uniref:NYN domain-containing protein n=1 Tax=Rosettibacter firmus TaxID=3111522 RepID=UPI00336C1332
MNHYIIDGNNLIGSIPELNEQHKKDKLRSREDLVVILNNYFSNKKFTVSLHFDGFENIPLRLVKGKIYYSKNRQADELIRKEIDNAKSKRLLTIITSDLSLQEYAKVNGCNYMTSKEFYNMINNNDIIDEEERRIQELKNLNEEFRNMFCKE